MLVKHPHTATISWYSEPTKDSDTGIYSEGVVVTHEVTCRFEPAGDSAYNSNDGMSLLTYGYKVYLSKLDFTIPRKATITKDSIKMDISRVDVYQRHVVLWL